MLRRGCAAWDAPHWNDCGPTGCVDGTPKRPPGGGAYGAQAPSANTGALRAVRAPPNLLPGRLADPPRLPGLPPHGSGYREYPHWRGLPVTAGHEWSWRDE